MGVAQAKPACKHTIATRKCYQYNTKPKRPASSTFIKVQTWNDECIHKFQTELNNANIYDMLDPQLNADPTDNLTTLNVLISQAKDKHLPTKFVKFNKHKHTKIQLDFNRHNPIH